MDSLVRKRTVRHCLILKPLLYRFSIDQVELAEVGAVFFVLHSNTSSFDLNFFNKGLKYMNHIF